jgi:hypothetical protein
LDNFFFFLKKNVYLFKLEAFMQKKIYPLFLVPCFLALCLVLVFIASCGGGGGGGDDDGDKSSSSDGGYAPSSVSNDERIVITGYDVYIDGGGKLMVTGTIDLTNDYDPKNPDKPLTISKIEVKLASDQNASPKPEPSITRTLFIKENLINTYSLDDWKEGLEFVKDCSLNRYTYNIYLEIYLSDNTTVIPSSRVTYSGFKLPADQIDSKCRSYTLTTTVEPNGGGSVSPSSGKYEGITNVTLTATPNSGYDFFNWVEDGSIVGTSRNYTAKIDNDIILKAVFVEDRTLSRKSTTKCNLECNIDLGGGGSVTFTKNDYNELIFKAKGNASIIDRFKTKDGTEEEIAKEEGPLPNTLSTKQFVLSSTENQEIGYSQAYYFAVKINSSTWFVLSGQDSDDFSCGYPTCTEVIVWGK